MKRNPYPKYKPSGVEWMGYVPEHWEVKKLKFIGTSLIGLTYSPDDVVDEDYEGGKHLVLRSTNIQDGKISLHENVYVTTRVEKVLNVRKWDILICARNGSRHLVGKNALINETNNNMTFGAFTTVFRSKINPFLFYYFASNQFQYQSTGFLTTTINQLTNGNLNSIITTLPTLSEQQAITAFLDRETGRIDTLIGKNQKLIELLKEKRTALISQAVTKGLNPKVKMKPSGVEWMGDVPEHWDVKRFKYIARLQTGNTPLKSDSENYSDEGVLWIKPDDLSELVPIIDTKEYLSDKGKKEARVIPPYSPLVCCIGTIGKFGYSEKEVTTNQQINSIKYKNKILPKYGLYQIAVSEKEHIKYANTNVVSILNTENQSQICFPVPPLPEQQAIAAFLDSETDTIDALIAKVETAIEKLKEYRTALISAAVTGKIDVREVA